MATVLRSDHRVTPPSPGELTERARSLAPMLREHARATEDQRRVSADTIAALARLDLLALMKPRAFGGLGLGPSALARVGFELGRSCGSTAWCAMIANCNAWYASYWPLEAQRELWAERSVIIASSAIPTGKSEAVDGGYLISGRWPFASNCDNSAWFFVSCGLTNADGSPAGAGWFLTPRETLEIDHDSWRVSGLQGTGSKTLFAVAPVFIPEHRMIRLADIQAGTTPGNALADNGSAAFLFPTYGAVPLVAPLLGMAQGALDWFAEAMRSKVRFVPGPGAPPTAAQNPFTQERAGQAAVTIAAAFNHLLAELERTEAMIMAGETLSTGDRIRIRSACTFGSQQAVRMVNLLTEGAGANASDKGIPIQRLWRDANAGARHVGLDITATNALAGQHLFGLDPKGMF